MSLLPDALGPALEPALDPALDPAAADVQVRLPPRPYPGLRPFERHEWPTFFGREAAVDAVIDRLVEARMIFIHGDSGCGKSSLVRAGLFAQLEQGRAGPGWRTAIALPGEAPLWHVAIALAELADGPPRADTPAAEAEARVLPWRRALDFGPDAPAALGELYAAGARGGQPACLLIDQFEELFEHARRQGPAEADALAAALTAWQAAPPPGLYLAITMRSEYLGACARHGRFAEAVNATQYLLPRMTHADMLRAVREPAQLFDGEVTRELADRLIADAGDSRGRGQDQLPLIQHALMRLHGALGVAPGARWRLGIEHFPPRGGCAGLLSDHADEVSAAFVAAHPQQPRLVEDVMRALTEINAEGHAVRRPRTLTDVAAVAGVPMDEAKALVEAFRADGVSFMMPPPGRALLPKTRVDIGHEALIRCWQALAEPRDGWLVREFRNGLVWRSLLVQADSFERDARNVLGAVTTGEREEWMKRRNAAWAQRYGGGRERVEKLISASVKARDEAAREAQRAQRRQAKSELMKFGLIAAGVVIAVMGWLFYSREELVREAQVQFEKAQKTQAELSALKVDLDRRSAEVTARADELARLGAELQAAAQAGGSRAELSARVDSAARTLDREAQQLSSAVKLPSPQTVSPGPTAAVAARVYVHIAEESQRATVVEAGKRLAQQTLKGERVIVPGIQQVSATPSRAVLRCFAEDECKDEAPLIVAAINRALRSPQVVVEDLSARYGSSSRIRARHYELWFPPGEIVLR